MSTPASSPAEYQALMQGCTVAMELADGTMLLLDADMNCIAANAAACRLFGYTRDELPSLRPVLLQDVSPAQLDAAAASPNVIAKPVLAGIPACRKDGARMLLNIQRCARLPGVGWMVLAMQATDIPRRTSAPNSLAQANAELARLSIELQMVREEERKNLATRLHGDLGQLLAALRINLTLLQQQFPETAACAQVLASMDKLIISSITSLRRLSAELRPKSLGEGELFRSLHMLREEAAARHGLTCELQAQETDLQFDDTQSTMIFRLAQDALMHVFPHLSVERVTMACERQNQRLQIHFQGQGLNFSALDEHHPAAYGLAAMHERINILNGQMKFINLADTMESMTISLPIGDR